MYQTTWWYCSRTALPALIKWAGVQRQCLQSRRREATTQQQYRFKQLSPLYSPTLIIEAIKETHQEAKLFALLKAPLCSPWQGVGLSFTHTHKQHKSIEVDYWWKCFYSEDKTAAVLQHKSDPGLSEIIRIISETCFQTYLQPKKPLMSFLVYLIQKCHHFCQTCHDWSIHATLYSRSH